MINEKVDIYKDIFGNVKMGYVIISSNKFTDWRTFCEQAIGLHKGSITENILTYRIDEYEKRFIIIKGNEEDVISTGWEVYDEISLEIILARLHSRDISFSELNREECSIRGIRKGFQIKGPKGLFVEIYTDPIKSTQSLRMLTSGFKTGNSGMGHIAMVSRIPVKMQRFWQEIFDARYSDHIQQTLQSGVILDVNFFRLNERHHSIAVAATRDIRIDPLRTKVQHINLEVATLEDMAQAYKRCGQLGFSMNWEVGQHTNDKEISFYVITPSGFEIEIGWNPIHVNESSWEPQSYNGFSIWGHKTPNNQTENLFHEFFQLQRGAISLLVPEYSPLVKEGEQ
ncbi:MAG: extradiol ring-cleavage dioxygenase [Spirochaetia bacterium]|nr:extradiol ring-cleavage dioxygenase [Spirochaetia bacterium]